MAATLQIHLPQDLVNDAQRFVREGWATGFDELMAEALRRYLESHGPALTEAIVREDVAWGLDGRD